MKNILLSLALLILVVLLLLPPGLRMFGKDLYKEKKISKINDEVEILSCEKINETVSTSFVNGKAYNIKYEINGNHVPEETLEETTLPDGEEDEVTENDYYVNTLIDDFKKYAEISYKEDKNITQFSIAVNLIDIIPEPLMKYTTTIDEVSSVYKELSFSCTSQKYQ